MNILRRDKSRRRVVLAISDIHAGHVLGLCNPATFLVRQDDDGRDYDWKPELTRTQYYLWELFEEHIDAALDFAAGDDVVVLHVGDVTQGDRFADGMMKSITPADQREIAAGCLQPVIGRQNVTRARLATGTLVHVPNCAEARVSRLLAERTGKDVRSCHHSRLNIGGVVFDVAHHGPFPGSRDWLRGNVARYYLKSAVYEDRRLGVEPARVYLRGHYHDYVPETIREDWNGHDGQHDLVIVPSYCGMGEHGRKVTRSAPRLTNGVVVFEIIDGQLVRYVPFKATLDLRSEETL